MLSSTCEMTLIDTFQNTPHLPSKGAVGSGNTSRIRVIRPESYCTVLYSIDLYRSVETSLTSMGSISDTVNMSACGVSGGILVCFWQGNYYC